MTESSSTKENGKSPRKLNAQDQRQFEHWQRVLSGMTLFSAEDSPRKGYTLKDIPPPDVPPTTLVPRHHTTPEPRSKFELEQEVATARIESQRKGCISVINKLFEKSPIVIFTNSELKKLGCSPPVYCAPCNTRTHGGFHPEMGITICQNNVGTIRKMESVLVHEMMHAFDHCRFNLDYNNLKQVACSEVHAPI